MKSKRIISALLTLIMVLTLLPGRAYSTTIASGDCGTSVTWELGNDGTLTVSGTGKMNDYGDVNNQPWRSYKGQITAVVVESGVTSIGNCAFAELTALESVSIASTVLLIDRNAFNSCTALEEIEIPEGVTTMKAYVFGGCTALKKVLLPHSLTSTGDGIFSGCTSLLTAGPVGSGSNIEFAWKNTIPGGAFIYANCLQSVVLPEGLKEIGGSAFAYAYALKSVAIPYTVNVIGNNVFKDSGVTAVYFNNTSTSIKFWLNNATFGNKITMYYPSSSSWWAGVVTNGSGVYQEYDFYCTSINSGKHFDVVTASQEATCTTGGYIDYHCYMCAYDHTVELEVKPHTEGEAVTENYVEAGCTEAGSYDSVVYCTVCGQEQSRETVVIPAHGHKEKTPVVENEIDPGCTENGSYESVVYCDYCGDELSRKTCAVDALGHTEGEAVKENSVAATCTKDGGYDMAVYCSVCGDELSRKHTVIPAHGHKEAEAVQENYVEPSCTEAGGYDMVVYCETCGEELSRVPYTIDALGHTEGEAVQENYVAPTCTEAGGYDMVVYCTVCDEELSRTSYTLDAIGHDWDEGKLTTDPTCTDKGVKTYTCKNDSKHTYTELVDAKGHLEADAVRENYVDPTCTEAGGYDMVVYCTVCGDELSRTPYIIDALGHTEGEAVQENYVAPTCTEAGGYDMVVYCTVCDEELSRTSYTIDAIGHDWDEGKITTKPTCTKEGIKTFTCKNDSKHTYTESVAALGHTEDKAVRENDVEPTCTETGSYDMVVYCKTCGEELSRSSHTVDALGHTEGEAVRENDVDPTCTVDGGYDMVVYCTVCDEELSRTHHTVDALGHAEGEAVRENDVAPTCEDIGSYDMVVYCTVCQAELSRTTHTVDPIGHDWDDGEITTDPTCTEKGIKTFTCKNDAAHTYTEAVDALGHTPADAVKENCIDSTCVEDGGYDLVVYCSVCNSELSRTHHIIDALGHTESEAVEENYIAATCTDNGSFDVVIYCITCQTELSRTTHTIDAIGHDWDDGEITTDPTCTKDGVKTFTCKNDAEHTYTEAVAALGHTEGEAAKENCIDSTCEEDGGYDIAVYCGICGEELSRTHHITDATGHEEGEAVEENYIAATCTEAGSYDMVVYCTVCQKVLSKTSHTLEAIGHNYESVTTDATCTVKGYTTHTCKNCGDSYQDAWVDALGHAEGEAVKGNEVAATCTDKGGYDLVTCCTKCNTELSKKSVVLDATGHNMESGVCKNCGYIEEIPKTGDVDGYWLAVAILMTTASLVVLLLNNKKRMEF